MIFDIMQNPGMAQHVPVYQNEANLNAFPEYTVPVGHASVTHSPAVILSSSNTNAHEEVEESLSIVDKEKELIIKALKKHRGKRRDAAMDLGISERTLYRKLKEYDIEHL
jgi:DNA-binding NtrC family response regulator